MSASKNRHGISLWIKVPYTLLALVVLPVYWVEYGPANFLWFSDIAFFVMAVALWSKNRLLTSMMAIGVLPLEALWMVSFLTGGAVLGIADYMFDPTLPLWLRALSLFHFPMPAAIIYMLYRYGYDPRALYPQIGLSLFVIILTHVFTAEADNVNLIFTPEGLEGLIPHDVYFILMPLALIGGVIIPAHKFLKRYVPLRKAG